VFTFVVVASARQEPSKDQRPDFSGAWKLDTAASSAAGGGRGNGTGPTRGTGGGLALGPSPSAMTIRQDASSLAIEYRTGAATTRVRYFLDGRESRGTMPVGGRGTAVPAVFTSAWEDARLVTTMVIKPDGQPAREYREVRSLAADGSMVVEITRRDLPDNSRRSVYRK
jgi:hypothetical protein